MRIITDSMRQKYTRLFEEYVSKYGELYERDALEFIKDHFLGIDFECEMDIDILNQVYQSIGIFNEFPNNNYNKFYNLLSSRYDLNQHLLEVASGMFPAFARLVASKQRVGSVTAMDPDTIIDSIDGIKIIKAPLNSETDMTPYDFVYAISPCEALKEIIEVANKNDLEFCVLACGCTHLPKEMVSFRREVYYREYIDYIESIIKETIPSTLEYNIEYLSEFHTPVISTRRLNIH